MSRTVDRHLTKLRYTTLLLAAPLIFSAALTGQQAEKPSHPEEKAADQETSVVVKGAPYTPAKTPPAPADSTTEGSVTLASGRTISYRAVAGTITVGATDAQDALLNLEGQRLPDNGEKPLDPEKPQDAPPTARMFYVAYFEKGVPAASRPVTFLYNGGPGSSTMWLHMGSFGPRRIIVPDTEHPAAAPYKLANNDYSLLDVTDLVFIDAPGTGFSRIMGKDKEKAFWGVDPDAHAFQRFIRRFLTKHDRWNSPKYIFGESYGTPRSAVLSGLLAGEIDVNGVVLLSAILDFNNDIDEPRLNPGNVQSYALAIPTYAATAAYHHKLPTQPADLQPFLTEVEKFAMGDYMSALLQGSDLAEADKQRVAEKLHDYTGLSVAYLMKSDLRVEGGAFEKMLQDQEDVTTGRLDTRYQGPDLDPLSRDAEYDPQDVALSSAYDTAINSYVRNDLKYGENQTYIPGAYAEEGFSWDFRHQSPGGPPAAEDPIGMNVIPDLSTAMKVNPKMKIFLAGGYYDLATPFYEGIYEMHHLQIPNKLQANISYHYYPSGHMVYVNPDALKQFHDDLAAFIKSTDRLNETK